MILITGGLGFIGLHTARGLLDRGESVVLTQYHVAREPAFLRDELGKRAFVEQLDVTDAAALAAIGRRHHIDGVVHLAVPGLGALEPGEELRVNMLGLLNILQAAREWQVKRVSIASSVAVYGGAPSGPFLEDMPLRTTGGSATEAFKKAIESLGAYYGGRTGLDVVMLRIAGVYGPLYHSMSNLPSRLVHAAVSGQPLALRGELAEDTADLCYVLDCAEGIALLQTAPSLNHRVYNLGFGRVTTNRELADAIRAAVPGFEADLLPGRSANARDDAYMDLSRIRQDTGYEPRWPVERAVADYIEWLRAGNAE
jgi:UDP-glucose 4-epimerase